MRTSKHRSGAALVERLCRAKERQELIRVTRVIPGSDRIEGYVVAVGSKWFLVADTHETGLDGFVALRLRDVERVWRYDAGDELLRRFMEHRGEWPVAAPAFEIDLDTTAGLVRTVAAAEPLIGVMNEPYEPDVVMIGTPRYADEAGFLLVEVSHRGKWADELGRWAYRDISRVDFGGPYERMLAAVAGPVPEPWTDSSPA